jgi:hypothetical protein
MESGRPANPEKKESRISSARLVWARHTWLVVAMAPALIIGLRGVPLTGSKLMALKASPEGSTPTLLCIHSNPSDCRASP